MKHSATTLDPAAQPHEARASWPLPEPTLAYFPDVRFAQLGQGPRCRGLRPSRGGIAVADDFGHVPVLLDRCVELLTPALTRREPDGSGAVLVDATLGAGGHSERFLTDLPGLRLIGLDRDPSALRIAGDRLERFGDRFTRCAPATTESPRRWPNRACGRAIRRRRAVRPRRVVHAAGSRRTGLLLRRRRAAGHADGPGPAADRRRHPQHLRSGRSDADPARLRRGALRRPHRRRRS